MALDRVEKMLQAKGNKIHLKGNREAYAVIIMISVCTELGYKIKSQVNSQNFQIFKTSIAK